MKRYTVAIIGVGARGGDVYGSLLFKDKERFVITALCDKDKNKLKRYAEAFEVKENVFSDEKEFFRKKRADLIVIATPDKEHYSQTMTALSLGYDILVEKPLTASKNECDSLIEMQKKYGGKVLVCHVLRYAPAFIKVMKMLESDSIGKLISIEATERVCYWHFAHSYVRGKWRNNDVAFPMILAKSCHDLDLLQYYARSRCKDISSIGGLSFFKLENAPQGAGERCLECPCEVECRYSAKKIYPERWKSEGSPSDVWPFNVLVPAPVTEEKLNMAIASDNYGRCVFKCDNDQPDHQLSLMTFENGVKASLMVTAFSSRFGRRMTFRGTEGVLILDEAEDSIVLNRFGEQPEKMMINELIVDNGYGHGGGDALLIGSIYEMLNSESNGETSLEASVESHLMGIAAEKSRLNGGIVVKVH